MVEVLQFIFKDFWHFVGTWLLLMLVCPWNKVTLGGSDKQILQNTQTAIDKLQKIIDSMEVKPDA